MPALDQLFPKAGIPAFSAAQCYEGVVASVAGGVYVVLPSYDRHLRWGPCLPAGAVAAVGDEVAVIFSEAGRPWLVGVS